MESTGYIRLLIVPCLVCAICLQCAHSQSLEDPGTSPVSLAGMEEQQEDWDTERYNEEADQTFNLVFHNYNHQLRPPSLHVYVDLSVTLTHVRHLDVDKQELQTVLDLDMVWVDSRLQWRPDKVKVFHESTDHVWCPHLAYLNGVAPVQQLYPKIVRIIHNGTVSWMRKEIVTTRCETKPSSREQACTIKLGFVTNRQGAKDQDRFFFSENSDASVSSDADVISHRWHLKSMNMIRENENETISTTIDLDLEFEQAKADKDNMKEGVSWGSTRYTTENYKSGHVVSGGGGGGGTSGQHGGDRGCGCEGSGGGSIHICSSVALVWLFVIGFLMIDFQMRDNTDIDR